MKYFPKKLTMTWIRNSYKEGSLTPECAGQKSTGIIISGLSRRI